MQTRLLEEISKRKLALQKELLFLNDLEVTIKSTMEIIDGNILVVDAQKAGIISSRAGNTGLFNMVQNYSDRDKVTLREMIDWVLSHEREFLYTPNAGRKSLNEIKALALRVK